MLVAGRSQHTGVCSQPRFLLRAFSLCVCYYGQKMNSTS